MIKLRGIAPDSGRIAVNIFSGDNPDDIVFHFNPRFDNDCVVRNSRLDGCWGNEERVGEMVFKPGKKFSILIIVQSNCFLVYVDDKEFCRYEYRAPICDTMLLEFDCGVEYR